VNGGEAIYSLGTGTRTPSEFLNLLRSFDVEMVVDVRRSPRSRFQHFEREELARLLEAGGFDYVYLGQELGGYRSGGYKDYLDTEEFKRGLERLEQLARVRRVAVVCAERLTWRCHRRFIGWELERDGWQVIHIIDEKRNWRPKMQ